MPSADAIRRTGEPDERAGATGGVQVIMMMERLSPPEVSAAGSPEGTASIQALPGKARMCRQ
jgi:hypothetical protein